ncbi:MAG: tRNA (guanosine(46)-N7)-methyltransferase TrmB [Oscillospiraceae bacterium]
MRMRKKPWARPELAACDFVVDQPSLLKNRWQEAFAHPAPLWLELGCGKGAFLATMSRMHPDVNFLGIDLKSEVLVLAKRKAEALAQEQPIDNLRLAIYEIECITESLGPLDAVERVYINFCNPWPKARHHKHRLTHTRQLKKYTTFLGENAHLFFKTDDDELFEDTLQYFIESEFSLLTVQADLPADHPAAAVQTEHEQMFRSQGLAIHYIEATAPLRTEKEVGASTCCAQKG